MEKVLSEGNSIKMKLVKKAGSLFRGDSDAPVYASKVAEVKSSTELLITTPRIGTKKLDLKKGDVYICQFFTAAGYYQGNVEILGLESDDVLTYGKVKILTKLERHQRREYYRMQCIQPLLYAKVNDDQRKIYSDYIHSQTGFRKRLVNIQLGLEDVTFSSGTLLDISGGGIRFTSQDFFKVGDYVIVQPVDEKLRNTQKLLIGEIVANRYIGKQSQPYENKVKFINITAEEREKIVSYIFNAERLKRRTSV